MSPAPSMRAIYPSQPTPASHCLSEQGNISRLVFKFEFLGYGSMSHARSPRRLAPRPLPLHRETKNPQQDYVRRSLIDRPPQDNSNNSNRNRNSNNNPRATPGNLSGMAVVPASLGYRHPRGYSEAHHDGHNSLGGTKDIPVAQPPTTSINQGSVAEKRRFFENNSGSHGSKSWHELAVSRRFCL